MPAATAIGPELGFKPLEGSFLVREHVRELHKGDTFAVGLAGGSGGHSEDPLSTVTVCLNPAQLSSPSYNSLWFLERNRDWRVMGCAFDVETFGPDLPFVDCMAVLCILRRKAELI